MIQNIKFINKFLMNSTNMSVLAVLAILTAKWSKGERLVEYFRMACRIGTQPTEVVAVGGEPRVLVKTLCPTWLRGLTGTFSMCVKSCNIEEFLIILYVK
jgi:hypothetical protein